MKRALAAFLLATTPLFATDGDCTSELTHLGTLYQLRSLMARSHATSYDVQRFADRRIDDLREPLREGGHRWIRWVRPRSGDGPVIRREHSVRAVAGRDTDRLEAAGGHVYAASVVVPRKRSLFRENQPVWVGTLEVSYELNNRVLTKQETVDQWMNPGTSRTIDFAGIAERATATVDAATRQKNTKQALVELHLRQAVPEDDPANPAYSTIRMLQRVRESPDPATVDAEIAAAETSLFPGSEALPFLTVLHDLRLADELIRSEKVEDRDKGEKLLKETLRRLR